MSGAGKYAQDSTVVITATASEGYRFVNWKNGNVVFCTRKDTTFKATMDLTLTAYFDSMPTPPEPPVTKYYTIEVMSGNVEMGSANISGNGTYQEGTNVTIVASPKDNHHFVDWKNGDSVFSSQAIYTFKAYKDLMLIAYFAKTVANEELPTSQAFVYAENRVIHLSEPMGQVQVFNTLGQCVYTGNATKISVRLGGLYLVRTDTRTYKVMVR